MDGILKSLFDPSWWFSGLFFILVAYALPATISNARAAFRKTVRKRQAAYLRKVRAIRLNEASLSYALGKANVHYALFLALSCGYLFVLAILSAQQKGSIPTVFAIILSLPVFAFELAWISSDSFVKDAIKARQRFFRKKRRCA